MKRLEFLLKYWKTMTVCSELNFACRYKSEQPSQFGSDSKNIIVLEKNLKLRPLSIAFVLDVLRFSGCFAQIFPRRLYRRSRRIFPRSIQRSVEKINEFSRKISSFATWTSFSELNCLTVIIIFVELCIQGQVLQSSLYRRNPAIKSVMEHDLGEGEMPTPSNMCILYWFVSAHMSWNPFEIVQFIWISKSSFLFIRQWKTKKKTIPLADVESAHKPQASTDDFYHSVS